MSIDFEYWLAQTAADHEVKSANAQQRGTGPFRCACRAGPGTRASPLSW